MFIKAKAAYTVDGRFLDAITMGNRKGECSAITYKNPGTGENHAFRVDEEGTNLIHLHMDNNHAPISKPSICLVGCPSWSRNLETIYDVICEVIPHLESEIRNFEFDIND